MLRRASKMRFGRFSLDSDQVRKHFQSRQCSLAQAGSCPLIGEATMKKIARKMLLTTLILGRRSGRIRGVEVATNFLTLAVLVSGGLYILAHGGN